ncbi:MAG TPA: nitroreductase family protein [Acidimicrobiia bacterium]|jgi:nitroreductase
MSDTYDRILHLRAIRSFAERPLDDADLDSILEAARWTGSAKNAQLWSFVVLTDPDRRAELAACGQFTTPIRQAPVAIAIVQEPGGYEFDSGRVAQNIMLAADSIGVGSCPVTLHDDGAATSVLGLPPSARCRYAVACGYPAPGAGPTSLGGRKTLGDLVHRDRYGHR